MKKVNKLKFKRITGYVGRNYVIATEYPSRDSDLNFYTIVSSPDLKEGVYSGTVIFTDIRKEEYISY